MSSLSYFIFFFWALIRSNDNFISLWDADHYWAENEKKREIIHLYPVTSIDTKNSDKTFIATYLLRSIRDPEIVAIKIAIGF